MGKPQGSPDLSKPNRGRKKGGGYDVKLDMPGVPLYLQFKRADCMTRRSAREISKDKVRLSVPFYRFAITQAGKSDQHPLLVELDDGTNQVFYAAPRFHELAQINQAWSAGEVAGRSIFVRPTAIGSLDFYSHHIAYDEHRAYLCSQPRPVEFVTAAGIAEKLSARLIDDHRSLRETLPEFNASLSRAWTRGRERAFEASRFGVPTLPGLLTLPSEISPGVTRSGVPRRSPTPLPEDFQQLRQLADNAVKLFDSQLVIVQRAG